MYGLTHNLPPLKLANTSGKSERHSVGGGTDKFTHCWWESKKVTSPFRLPKIDPTVLSASVWIYTGMRILLAAMWFVIGKDWKSPGCPLIRDKLPCVIALQWKKSEWGHSMYWCGRFSRIIYRKATCSAHCHPWVTFRVKTRGGN